MSYGLGASIGNMGLVGMGQKQQNEALGMLGQAAEEEQKRKLENERLEHERKQGNVQLGATAGALAGATYGSEILPGWGTVIGGVLGAVGGSLF